MYRYEQAVCILNERFGKDTLLSLATVDGSGRPSVRMVRQRAHQ